MKAVEKRVQAALKRLVASGVDRGAQVAVYRDGRLVVDVCAGVANPFTGEPVYAETLFSVFSVTKGITATVIHRLAERGLLSYGMRLAEVWPEFGVHGKERITLRHVLTLRLAMGYTRNRLGPGGWETLVAALFDER